MAHHTDDMPNMEPAAPCPGPGGGVPRGGPLAPTYATAIFYSRKAMILDTEAAVIANFEFLGHTDMDMEEEEGDGEDEIYDANTDTKPNKASLRFCSSFHIFFIIFSFVLLKNIFCYVRM
ncbi:uncharacterized protein LOC112588230 [Harpegnathos saltator]|uniref:uncharacterized protein LOC112588230 n=1 Tax=Harpegnathos saltator TaxID=610380 RepID=UPI000DBEE359|nr:uncharacterized protein LOC112588230 [Harpegnathos saltator]